MFGRGKSQRRVGVARSPLIYVTYFLGIAMSISVRADQRANTVFVLSVGRGKVCCD